MEILCCFLSFPLLISTQEMHCILKKKKIFSTGRYFLNFYVVHVKYLPANGLESQVQYIKGVYLSEAVNLMVEM